MNQAVKTISKKVGKRQVFAVKPVILSQNTTGSAEVNSLNAAFVGGEVL